MGCLQDYHVRPLNHFRQTKVALANGTSRSGKFDEPRDSNDKGERRQILYFADRIFMLIHIFAYAVNLNAISGMWFDRNWPLQVLTTALQRLTVIPSFGCQKVSMTSSSRAAYCEC